MNYRYRTRLAGGSTIVDRMAARWSTWPADDVDIEQLVVPTTERAAALREARKAPDHCWG